MSVVSIGDLARVFQSRHLTTNLKADLSRLGRELTTGVRSDIATAVSGDFGPIADIERLLTTLKARQTVTAEAAVLTDTMQAGLDVVQENGRAISILLLSEQSNQNSATRQVTANNARDRFDTIVAALNTHAAGRSLFAGAATDQPALTSTADMLADLTLATAAETTAAGFAAAVDTWFDAPGGGFETIGYLGSTANMGSLQVGDGESVNLTQRADDPALREVLKSFAMASLVAEGALAADPNAQISLMTLAGEGLIEGDQTLTLFRAGIGTLQERVETSSVRNSAEKTSLELARNDLIAVDPFEAATELQAAYAQLETFYTVTARLSRLNFTDYMR